MNCKNHLHRALLLLLITAILSFTGYTQIRWDGGGEDGQWSTAANWTGDVLPAATDDVVLDNSFVTGSYTLVLPAGNSTVTIRSLAISPLPDKTIEVIIPSTNIANPAFVLAGPAGYLAIQAGGIFRNASGVSSGVTMQLADSLRINNAGKYIHQTKGSHASIVQVLAKSPGTEEGIFEFNIPGTAGYIISLSGRTYGTLSLSAMAAGANRSYSSSGSQDAFIRGNLIINSNVNYNLNFTGKVTILKNYLQYGGRFNLASQAYNTLVRIAGNMNQYNGSITEEDEGLPVIELNGKVNQDIMISGHMDNQVTFRVNNPAGITLQTPVALPYKLELVNGKVTTSALNILTLLADCTVQADSLSDNSFINGPLRKEGLSAAGHFLFPVGKGNMQRWVALKNATGNYTVEFIKSSPQLIHTACGDGIHHISGIEHWLIRADMIPVPSAGVKLSFNDPNSGGVTDLATLRVAQFTGSFWEDAGNAAVTGTPGSNGSVLSTTRSLFTPAAGYFALASSTGSTNPLPVRSPYSTGPPQPAAVTTRLQLQSMITSGNTPAVLTATAAHREVVQLWIADREGKLVKRSMVLLQKGSNTVTIPLPVLPAGIYIIYAVNGNERSNALRFRIQL